MTTLGLNELPPPSSSRPGTNAGIARNATLPTMTAPGGSGTIDEADAAITAAITAHYGHPTTSPEQSAAQYTAEARAITTALAAHYPTDEETAAHIYATQADQAATLYAQLCAAFPPPPGLSPAHFHIAAWHSTTAALQRAKTATAAAALAAARQAPRIQTHSASTTATAPTE